VESWVRREKKVVPTPVKLAIVLKNTILSRGEATDAIKVSKT
jgi:hypothetical protein